jgi:hypothetical protein
VPGRWRSTYRLGGVPIAHSVVYGSYGAGVVNTQPGCLLRYTVDLVVFAPAIGQRLEGEHAGDTHARTRIGVVTSVQSTTCQVLMHNIFPARVLLPAHQSFHLLVGDLITFKVTALSLMQRHPSTMHTGNFVSSTYVYTCVLHSCYVVADGRLVMRSCRSSGHCLHSPIHCRRPSGTRRQRRAHALPTTYSCDL